MANTYLYSGPGTRWAEGNPTAVDLMNIARVNCDHLHEALNLITNSANADGTINNGSDTITTTGAVATGALTATGAIKTDTALQGTSTTLDIKLSTSDGSDSGVTRISGGGGMGGGSRGGEIQLHGEQASSNPGSLRFFTGTTAGLFSFTNGDFLVDTDTLYVDVSADRVGINTTVPQDTLDIVSSSAASYPLLIRGDIDSDGGYSGIQFGFNGGTSHRKAAIHVEGTSGSVQPDMHFLLDSAADSGNAVIGDAKMSILNSGNVGIGTTAPTGVLSVSGDHLNPVAGLGAPNNYAIVIECPTDTGEGNGIAFTNDTSTVVGAAILHIDRGSANFGDLAFYTKETSGGTATERMRIDYLGNVGIGTATPTGTLNVVTADVAVTPDTDADDLVVENDGRAGISILGSDTSGAHLIFGSASDAVGASLRWNHNNDLMTLGTNNAGASLAIVTANGAEAVRIDSSGNVGIGTATANANMTKGLTIDQGTNDDEILALSSSGDIAHGMTNYGLTETFFNVMKLHATNGGAFLRGFSEDNTGLRLEGLSTNDNTTKGTAATAPVMILAAKKTGTGAGSVGSDGNLMTIGDRDADTRFIFDVEGSAHADVEWTTYDKHDDVQLLRDIEATMVPEIFGGAVQYREADLIKLGLFGKDSIRRADNGKMRGMMNQTKMVMLHHGAIQKVASALAETRKDLKEAQQKLMRLEAA